MTKKKRTVEQQTQRELISKDAMTVAMRRLMTNDDFILLRRDWLNRRVEILEDGKAKPSEAQWHKLAGFDVAILVAESWAMRETKKESGMADDLQDQLNGGK